MKKLLNQLFLFSAIGGTLFLASCGSDDPEPVAEVSITVTGDTDTQSNFDSDETVDFNIAYTSEAGISSFVYTPSVDGNVQSEVILNPAVDLGLDLTTQANEGSFNFGFELNETLAGSQVSITFEIVDQTGGSASETVTFQVNAAPAISEYTAVLLGGFQNANEPSFYNVIDNTTYTYSEAQNNSETTDLLFYYADTPGYTIAAPDNSQANTTLEAQTASGSLTTFATRLSTRFKLLDGSFDYDAQTTSADLENAYPEVGDDQERITQLSAGQVFAIRTDNNRGTRYGVIEVESVAGTQGSERAITLNVKIQSVDN